VTLALKSHVTALDIGRLAGKVKLFIGAMQQMGVLNYQAGVMMYLHCIALRPLHHGSLDGVQ